MVGMDYFYADQGVQCPSDEETAQAIVRLVEAGVGDRLLLSQDVFLKMMTENDGTPVVPVGGSDRGTLDGAVGR